MRISDWSSDVCSSDLSMNMGSINFNISGAGSKIQNWLHDWEKPYLEMTRDFILSNTFSQIERGMRELGAEGTRFEFECYDVSHLYNLAHFVDRKVVQPPFFVQGVFGIRSEEHTSELQSLMRISYAVYCFKKKNYNKNTTHNDTTSRLQ